MTSYTTIEQAIQLLMYKLLLYSHCIAWWHKKIVSAIDFFIKKLVCFDFPKQAAPLSFHKLCVHMHLMIVMDKRNSSIEYYHTTCIGKTKHKANKTCLLRKGGGYWRFNCLSLTFSARNLQYSPVFFCGSCLVAFVSFTVLLVGTFILVTA